MVVTEATAIGQHCGSNSCGADGHVQHIVRRAQIIEDLLDRRKIRLRLSIGDDQQLHVDRGCRTASRRGCGDVVCFAVVKSKKDETRAAVEIARKRYGRFIIIAPLIRESGLDFKARLGELCTPRLAHASPAEKDGLRPGSIARTGNLSPGSRTQASAQQGSPQSGDCSNWLNGNLCLQKV